MLYYEFCAKNTNHEGIGKAGLNLMQWVGNFTAAGNDRETLQLLLSLFQNMVTRHEVYFLPIQ